MLTKTCSSCKIEKNLDLFGKNSTGKFGRKSKCKRCLASEEKARRALSPLTEEQREAVRQRVRAWSATNKERKAVASKAWAHANTEKRVSSSRHWQGKNIEKARSYRQRWLRENPEKARKASRVWRESNPDRYRETAKKWRVEHQDYWRKRVGTVGLTSEFKAEDWNLIQTVFGHRCAYCLRGDLPLTMDHVLPISRGGRHTPENVVPACKSCNSRKKDRPIWMMAGL